MKQGLQPFFEEFYKLMMKASKEPDFSKTYKNRSKYTERIQDVMENIKFKESRLYREYFDIDFSWWKNDSHKKQGSVNIYDWTMVAAVEHENAWSDWTYEVEKLDSINCPLRIVIGYTRNKKRDNEKGIIEEQCQYLKNCADLTKEFGVILLNQNLDYTIMDGPFDMRCYRLLSSKQTYSVERVELPKE